MARKNDIGVLRMYINLRETIGLTLKVLISGLFLSDIMCLLESGRSWISLFSIVGLVASITFFLIFPSVINRFQKERDYVCIMIAFAAYFLLLVAFLPSALYVYSCGNMNLLNSVDNFVWYFASSNILLPMLFFVFVSYLYWIEIILLYRNSESYYNCIKFKNQNE